MSNGSMVEPRLRPLGRRNLIWPMIGLAVIVHGILLLVLSPKLFAPSADSPERLFERAEAELARGNYPEAMALYQKVMDQQPKIPPVFEKAAEQHKLADRMARQYQPTTQAAVTESETPPAAAGGAAATKPTATGTQKPATKPTANEYIPPELRGG